MYSEFLVGISKTLLLFGMSYFPGFLIGTFIAIVTFFYAKVRSIFFVVSVFFSIVPLLAVLFWFHYPLQTTLGVVWSPLVTSIIVLSIYVAFNVVVILNDTFDTVHKKYNETVKVLGLSINQYILKVLGPISLFLAAPRLLTLAIVTIHATMFASLIGVDELFRVTQRLNAEYLKPVELYSFMALGYLIICLPLYFIGRYISKIFSNSFENA